MLTSCVLMAVITPWAWPIWLGGWLAFIVGSEMVDFKDWQQLLAEKHAAYGRLIETGQATWVLEQLGERDPALLAAAQAELDAEFPHEDVS